MEESKKNNPLLVRKQITNSRGVRTTVWVRPKIGYLHQKDSIRTSNIEQVRGRLKSMGYGYAKQWNNGLTIEEFKKKLPHARNVERIMETQTGSKKDVAYYHYLYDSSRFGNKNSIDNLGEEYLKRIEISDVKALEGEDKYTDGELNLYKKKSISETKNSRVVGDDVLLHVARDDREKYEPNENEWGGHWAARILSQPIDVIVRKKGSNEYVKEEMLPKIPKSILEEVSKWDIATVSPYSYSFYDIPDKSWNYTAEGSHRISDHWNFASKGSVHARTTENVPDDGNFRLAVYENGKYRILKNLGKVDSVVKSLLEPMLGY